MSSMPPPSIHILAMTETYGIASLECDDLLRGNAQPHLLTRHLTRRPTEYAKRLALVLPILHAHRYLQGNSTGLCLNSISGFIPFELSHLTDALRPALQQSAALQASLRAAAHHFTFMKS